MSLIVTGLLTFAGTSLNATGSFATERNTEFTITSAVNLAIQNTRYSFDVGSPHQFLNNATPELCASYPPQAASVNVYCTMAWQPYSANTRVFTYSACPSSAAANAATDCAAKPQLEAIVAFDDYPPGVASPAPTPSACTPIVQQVPNGPENGSCGVSMTQISWQWNPVVPAITSLSSSTGPTSGGTTVTITGTGFTSGETVALTPQLAQPPVNGTITYNPPVAATIVAIQPAGCALPTCIQVTTPAVTSGTAYYVTVTTPGGTSQTAASDSNSFVPIFTYAPVAPTVSGLVGTVAGSITGNTTIVVQGTGFWNAPNNVFPAQVFLCPTGGAAPVSSAECPGGLSGSVVGFTPPAAGSTLSTMTALTPSVSSAGTYYVQVEVYNVYSTQTNTTNPSNEFTYSVQAPLIVSITPLSGVSGTALTISGANFLTGSTVGFCAETNGNPTNANCPTNTSQQTLGTITATCWQSGGGCTATQIVVSVPTLAAGTYFPIVTLPAPTYNSTPPSQPYNQPSDIFTYT